MSFRNINKSDEIKLGRREFIKSSIAVAALGQTLTSKTFGKDEENKPIFTFLQLNDTHLAKGLENNGTYSSANVRLRWFIEAMNSKEAPDAQFMLYAGDMIHGGGLEKLPKQMNELKKEVIEKLPFEVFTCLGNHENQQRQGCPIYNEAYLKTFGKDRFNYVFDKHNIQFVVFDNSGMPPRPSIKMEEEHEELRVQRLVWLRKVFEESGDKPKILCCHIPLACIRDEEILAKSFGFPSYYAHDQELLSLLREYNNSILAVLSGHLHLTGMKQIDGIYHVSISGLASYPHDYGVYSVYKDRVEVRIRSVPESMHQPFTTNLHNRRRHGIDYTDSEHPTHELYIKGNADERAFSIPIKKL